MEEVVPIVVDNGSGVCKLGFGGDDAPRQIIRNCILRPSHLGEGTTFGGGSKDAYHGMEAINLMLKWKLNPTRLKIAADGLVINWDDLEKIWHAVSIIICE